MLEGHVLQQGMPEGCLAYAQVSDLYLLSYARDAGS